MWGWGWGCWHWCWSSLHVFLHWSQIDLEGQRKFAFWGTVWSWTRGRSLRWFGHCPWRRLPTRWCWQLRRTRCHALELKLHMLLMLLWLSWGWRRRRECWGGWNSGCSWQASIRQSLVAASCSVRGKRGSSCLITWWWWQWWWMFDSTCMGLAQPAACWRRHWGRLASWVYRIRQVCWVNVLTDNIFLCPGWQAGAINTVLRFLPIGGQLSLEATLVLCSALIGWMNHVTSSSMIWLARSIAPLALSRCMHREVRLWGLLFWCNVARFWCIIIIVWPWQGLLKGLLFGVLQRQLRMHIAWAVHGRGDFLLWDSINPVGTMMSALHWKPLKEGWVPKTCPPPTSRQQMIPLLHVRVHTHTHTSQETVPPPMESISAQPRYRLLAASSRKT